MLNPRRPRARHRVSTHERWALVGAWELVGVAPDAIASPERLDVDVAVLGARFAPMESQCSVGAALQALGALPVDEPPDLDGRDWWIRGAFAPPLRADDGGSAATEHLVFEGLATIVDVWLNGRWLGRSENMFLVYEADVSSLLRETNELVLCARALTTRLAPRRPRARWRSHLLASQEWRWLRTTQMGRMPGFGPQTPLVGPWRPIVLERRTGTTVHALDVVATHDDGIAGLNVDAVLALDGPAPTAQLVCGAEVIVASVERCADGWRVSAELRSADLRPWSPHTHGEPSLHPTTLHVESGATTILIDLGAIGFRSVRIDSRDGRFDVSVNGRRPFLRGTCWTPRDWLRPEQEGRALDREMESLRAAGINCVRLSGCFTYAAESFLDACDRHGVMVWQDLMFSVLDYPSGEEFAALCATEVAQQTALLQSHACVLAVCGSAEVDQQATMMGVTLDAVRHPLFHEHLAGVVGHALPHVPYWPSTPNGGSTPFRTNVGTSHYFGVGAYRRPLADARHSAVRFTTECLAFAHPPEPESPAAITLAPTALSRARWKARVPRDGGADWDFEDTRDFYVEHLLAGDCRRLRAEDPERYLALGRAATAIAVERTMVELRRAESPCQGAMTWLWADPWPGPGWGYVDSAGRPKSVWYAMRRALRPRAIGLTNEGMNGVDVHVWNDDPAPMGGVLHVRLLCGARVAWAAARALRVEGGTSATFSVDAVLNRFVDPAGAYRFGTRSHDTVHAVWTTAASDEGGTGARRALVDQSLFAGQPMVDDATLLLDGDARPVVATGLRARVVHVDDGGVVLALTSTELAQMVRIGSAAYVAADSYFTLVPGVERRVLLSMVDPAADRSIVVEALNDADRILLRVP